MHAAGALFACFGLATHPKLSLIQVRLVRIVSKHMDSLLTSTI